MKTTIAEIREKFERHSHEPWMWGKNRVACFDKWPCDYVPVHIEAADVQDSRLLILEQAYKEEIYDPSKALEKGEEL